MRSPILVLCALLCALTACSQSEGDSCQQDSDCDDGLVCTIDDRTVVRGVCQDPDDVEEPPAADTDAAPPVLTDPDASMDAGRDGGAPDAGDGAIDDFDAG